MSTLRLTVGAGLLTLGSAGLAAFALLALPWEAWACFGLLVAGALVMAGR